MIWSITLLIISCKKIFTLRLIRSHFFIHKFKIWLHFTNITSYIVFILNMYINRFFSTLSWNSWCPCKICFLISITNPTAIMRHPYLLWFILINSIHTVNSLNIQLIPSIFLFFIQYYKTIIINLSIFKINFKIHIKKSLDFLIISFQ